MYAHLAVDPSCPTGTTVALEYSDVLSVCMILLQERHDLTVSEKLRMANRVVRDYLEGTRQMIPVL